MHIGLDLIQLALPTLNRDEICMKHLAKNETSYSA